jgi:competence protein ComEC
MAGQMQEARLLGLGPYVGLGLVGASGVWGSWAAWPCSGPRGDLGRLLLAALAAAALGWGWAGARAEWRLAESLPSAIEGRDLSLIGVVASLPVERQDGLRFVFEVESARLGPLPVQIPAEVPARVMLGWYGQSPESLAPSTLAAGQRWRLPVRLKRPHGSVNPDGFDYELWLFEQGLRASGYVRLGPASAAELLGESGGYWVERWRQRVREAIQRRLGDSAAAGLLAALAIGDQAAIGRDDWDVFRVTGVAHLVAISGLHVTMFAWLAGALVRAGWRRFPGLLWRCPAVVAGRWAACFAAGGYALLAGWGVPAQRTVYMLAAATLLRHSSLRWPWPAVLASSALVVCLIDPWALLQPGFWLSFVAVGVLMADGAQDPLLADRHEGLDPPPTWRQRVRHTVAAALRTQALATLALAPLSMLLFQQASVVGFLVNLLAIPVVTLLITPLALLGVVVPPLWSLAALLAEHGMALLAWCAAWPWASWRTAAAPGWALGLALLGTAVLAAPVPRSLRCLGFALVLPLCAPPLQAPLDGAFDLLAADVGQGNAVLVRTATHHLLYDAGPQYSRENDAGSRVLVPLLRALGVAKLDVLMLSHRDTDHVGGARAVLGGIGAWRVASSLEAGHPLRAAGVPHQPCEAGQHWVWDGVQFDVLHPAAEDVARAATSVVRPNALSCVLRVAAGDRVALLTGDIEREQEQAIVSRLPAFLRAEVLLVPHHGSKTSSSPAWLDAVAPQWGIVQVGYRNRFGHPAPEVMARYRERGIEMVRSDDCGAWRWSSETGVQHCEREHRARYWHSTSASNARP